MAKRFFVTVSRLGDFGKINRELSGELWATNSSDAEIEVGKYRDELNYADLEWMGYDFHIVMAQKENDVRKLKGHTKWWKNRVTPRPKKKKNAKR